MKKIITMFKKIWKNDCKDIIVPAISLVVFIVLLILIGIIRAAIALVLINAIYFISKRIIKKDKKISKKQKKKRIKKR